ncbi:molybdate transport system regulatory protein [Candidatus Magnetomoraceae bacterium gMMP-1]
MPKKSNSFLMRSKIWIEDDSEKVVFGLGRVQMLESIQRHGSIYAAAKELKMSYRSVWKRIKVTEERLGKKLLIRSVGGASGGGSKLTPFAKGLVKQFRTLHKRVLVEADELFKKLFLVEDG